MNEALSSMGRKKGGPDGAGVKSGLSENMGTSVAMNGYQDGDLSDDNVAASGRGGYARASKKATHGAVGGGFQIDGGK